MAITVTSQSNSSSLVNVDKFYVTTDATAAARTLVQLGFKPRSVTVEQIAGTGAPQKWEWHEGMAAANAIQTIAAGTRSIIASNGITVGSITVATGDLNLNIPKSKDGTVQSNVSVTTTTDPKTADVYADGTVVALGTSVVPASSTLLITATY